MATHEEIMKIQSYLTHILSNLSELSIKIFFEKKIYN